MYISNLPIMPFSYYTPELNIRQADNKNNNKKHTSNSINAYENEQKKQDVSGRVMVSNQKIAAYKDHIEKELQKTKLVDFEKYKLIERTMSNLKMDKGISKITLLDFMQALLNLYNTTTLKNALDSGVQFKLIDDSRNARFTCASRGKQTIKIYQTKDGRNNASSLAHELGHAFDGNCETQFLLNYNCDSLDNTIKRKKFLKEYNFEDAVLEYNINSDYDKKEYDILKMNKFPGVSASVEYMKALQKDLDKMSRKDTSRGLDSDYTFLKIAHNLDNNNLGHYIGADRDTSEIDKYKMQKELFAQLTAIATSRHTCQTKESDKALVEYFPNTYFFVSQLLKGIVIR